MECSNFTRKECKRISYVKKFKKIYLYTLLSLVIKEILFYFVIKNVKQTVTLFITKIDYIKAFIA